MHTDLATLRRQAVAVRGVVRLADRRDGPDHATVGPLRVFDEHVEVDVVLAVGHSVAATTRALRRRLAPHLGGRAIHVTVVDVEEGQR